MSNDSHSHITCIEFDGQGHRSKVKVACGIHWMTNIFGYACTLRGKMKALSAEKKT